MVTARLVAIEIHDEVLFLPGGAIHTWVHEVASELFFWVEREAPMNRRPNKSAGEPPPGHLISSLYSDVDQVGKEFNIVAGSRAYYTRYVIHGTSTIFAQTARVPKGQPGAGQFQPLEGEHGMRLPANPGYGAARWHQRVRGQKANNFLGRGYDMTARTHPALKGVSME